MINIYNGDIKLFTNTTINKGFSENKLQEDEIYKIINRAYTINGWKYYKFKLININNLDFMLELVYKESNLEMCSIMHYGSFEEIPFSTENEIKRQHIHNQWLVSMLGEPSESMDWGIKYKFTWGEISSVYSPQTPESAIFFKWI